MLAYSLRLLQLLGVGNENASGQEPIHGIKSELLDEVSIEFIMDSSGHLEGPIMSLAMSLGQEVVDSLHFIKLSPSLSVAQSELTRSKR